MKKVFLLFSLIVNQLQAQTTLSAGDIAVIGFKTNTNTDAGNDAIKLVNLVDLECNTTFIITDNNWRNSSPIGWACDDDEFGLLITCNTSISAGSIFYIDVSAAGGTAVCSGGTITKIAIGNPWGTDYGLSSGGDNIYILQGTRVAPVFIFAIKNGAFANNSCSNKDQAGIPAGLTLGTNAVAMSSSQNQWHFNCVSNNGTRTSIRTAICNAANWTTTGGQSWNTNSGVFTITDGNFPSGVLAVSGAGCGCLSGCNLAYSGSTNCTGVAGNCSAGYQAMSRTITVPVGCTYSITAEMKNRGNGCSSSGADGNCQTCDVVKVDVLSGSKSFQQGASNSSLLDSYSSIGPSTIVVSGRANRADEIITYSIKATPCNCLTQLLPMELLDFNATSLTEKYVELNWMTATEINNDYFTVEKSENAINWEILTVIKSLGNSQHVQNYSVFDSSPFNGISYYRLKQTDFNGRFTYSKIKSVYLNESNQIGVYPNPNETGLLKIETGNINTFDMKLVNSIGQIIYERHSNNSNTELDLTKFEKGMYILFITTEGSIFKRKIIYK
jgi:hypothetical protein